MTIFSHPRYFKKLYKKWNFKACEAEQTGVYLRK